METGERTGMDIMSVDEKDMMGGDGIIKGPRVAMLVVKRMHEMGYRGLVYHSYIKDGMGVFRAQFRVIDIENEKEIQADSFNIISFSSFQDPGYPFSSINKKTYEQDINKNVDALLGGMPFINEAKNINNESYVSWYSELVSITEPEGIYLVEEGRILFPNGKSIDIRLKLGYWVPDWNLSFYSNPMFSEHALLLITNGK